MARRARSPERERLILGCADLHGVSIATIYRALREQFRPRSRCGSIRSPASRAAAQTTATRRAGHGKPGRSRRNTSATSSPPRATKPALQAGTRSGAVGATAVGSDSNGLAVAHTFAGRDQQVSCRGAEAAMAEQQLDGAQIGARLQQVNGERVAQGMWRHRLREAAP